MSVSQLSIGISPCPNDIFVYHAILSGKVTRADIALTFKLLDIQQLNNSVLEGSLDIAKISFALAKSVREQYDVMPVGAALGFGVGPIIVGKSSRPINEDSKVLCPGTNTTAALLFNRFFPQCKNVSHVVFSDIIPALQRDEADFGVLIHEGRFTYQQSGLTLSQDLGALWESKYKLPLPLGGLVAKRTVSSETREIICSMVRESILYSQQNPAEVMQAMQQHAQELDVDAIRQHVQLYVNKQTQQLDELGYQAISKLMEI